jgi:hypothetical protein
VKKNSESESLEEERREEEMRQGDWKKRKS